jgi:hypothetical protein
MERASENTSTPSNGKKVGQSPAGDAVRSKEGKGQDLLEDDFDGRVTMQVTGSMHDVSLGIYPMKNSLRMFSECRANGNRGK